MSKLFLFQFCSQFFYFFLFYYFLKTFFSFYKLTTFTARFQPYSSFQFQKGPFSRLSDFCRGSSLLVCCTPLDKILTTPAHLCKVPRDTECDCILYGVFCFNRLLQPCTIHTVYGGGGVSESAKMEPQTIEYILWYWERRHKLSGQIGAIWFHYLMRNIIVSFRERQLTHQLTSNCLIGHEAIQEIKTLIQCVLTRQTFTQFSQTHKFSFIFIVQISML